MENENLIWTFDIPINLHISDVVQRIGKQIRRAKKMSGKTLHYVGREVKDNTVRFTYRESKHRDRYKL